MSSLIWAVLLFGIFLSINWLSIPFFSVEAIANYAPLHTLLELLSIIISVMIFGTVWANIPNNKNSRNHIVLSCSFLGVAVLDLLHVLSFPEMPDLVTPSGPEKTINFWLMARYFSVLSLLLVSVLSWKIIATRSMYKIILICVLVLISILAIIGLFYPSLIPRTFIEGQGLTPFKIISEYFIAALYLIICIRLIYLMRTVQPYDVVNLFMAACLMSMSEIFFTLYSDMTDSFNLLGHLYKTMAYGFIYKSIFITNIVKPYEQLSEAQNLLHTVIEAIPMCLFWKDSESRYLGCNTLFARDAGKQCPDQIIDNYDDKLSWHTQASLYQSDDQKVMSTQIPKLNYKESVLTPPGETTWLRISKIPIHAKDNSVLGVLGVYEDVTASVHSQEKLQLAANVFTHAREGIMITDATATIIEVNGTYTEISGYSHEELIGQNPRMLQSGRQSPEFYSELWKTVETTGHWTGEIWNRRKNGEVFAEQKNISAVYDTNGVIQNYVAMCSDITTMKEYQGQLIRNAHYDPLTNLPNRVLLADRLSQAMRQCQRKQHSLAVLFLDLDGFKVVNDTYRHRAGDDMLISLSQLMKESLRESDTLSRFGGDEFVAVLEDVATIEDCQPILERLLEAAATPVVLGDAVMQVSASIGITLYPQDSVDADQLIRHADQAMYVAKQAGKNRYHLFDTAQDEAVKIQRESIGDIRSALERGEFVLHYQPKVNMQAGEVIGVEALIRWQHPVRGLIPPIEFLPVIEGHALSLNIGEWVIDTALTQIRQWESLGIHLPISVNISAYQLQKENFSVRLGELLAAHPDVNPCNLELEILETSALSDISHVSDIMNACSELGVQFSLDDFGTGYSSLTYLRRLPAGLIKIDQSFVRDMLIDSDDLAIIEGVIGLAKSFKRDVIAEGVETIAHGTALLQLGCILAQGYGIAKPMPASDVPAWAADWKPDDAWRRVKLSRLEN